MKQGPLLSIWLTLFCFGQNVHGQNIIHFFRLTEPEATQLYQNHNQKPDSTFFHTPISKNQAEGENGSYLKVVLLGESADVSLHSNYPFQVELLPNDDDLSILVKDSLGREMSEAEVLLDRKKVVYDPKTQTFHGKRSPKTRLLKVKVQRYSAYFEVYRNGYKPFPLLYRYDRFTRSRIGHILTWPLKIVHEPIRYVSRGIRSRYWPMPWKYWFSQKHKNLDGFIAFSKPTYRPGDTLKMKAYVASGKGRALNRKLNLSITQRRDKEVYEKKLKAERPGVYIFEMPLSDTLEMDKQYNLELAINEHKSIRHTFRLEDYELEEINYDLKSSAPSFLRGEKCRLILSAKTTNALAVPDAKADIYILSGKIEAFHRNEVEIPDTLWHGTESLGVRGEWEVLIPDSLFPPASMQLRCQVYFNNSAGQLAFKETSVDFGYQPHFKLSLDNDKLVGTALMAESDSLVLESLFENDAISIQKVRLPFQLPLDPHVNIYTLKHLGEDAEFSLYLQEENPLLAFSGNRSADSIQIYLRNPRKIPCWYQIKTHAGTVKTGFTRDSVWQWQQRDQSVDFYQLTYQYLWGGSIKVEKLNFRHYPRALLIDLEGPDRVIPGQENIYNIQVKRHSGRPAKGVDLSAGAINAQFGDKISYSAPQVTYRRQLPAPTFPSMRLNQLERKYNLLMTRFLAQTFRVQDELYYQYRYSPRLLTFRRDSSHKRDTFYRSIAQVAPFVVKGGKMQPVFLIYLNGKLAYYYQSSEYHPYSILAIEGHHQLTIRTQTHEYKLDSIYLRSGEKLELVINEDYWANAPASKNIQRKEVPKSFSPVEEGVIKKNIFVLRSTKSNDSTFVWADPRNIFFIPKAPKTYLQIGPFTPQSRLTFLKMNQFKSNFEFEPGFSYEVDPGRERLYAYDFFPKSKDPILLPSKLPDSEIGEYAISPKSVRATSPKTPKITFDPTPQKTNKRGGKYQFHYPYFPLAQDSLNLYLVVLKAEHEDHRLILRPNTRFIPHLPVGVYELMLFNNKREVLRKKIEIKRDTLVYDNLAQQSFQRVDSLLPALLGQAYLPIQNKQDTSLTNRIYSGRSQLVRGQVVDRSGEPMIGATVMVKGTTIGVVSDVDGNYEIQVPFGFHTIVVSYVGFSDQEIPINRQSNNELNVQLEESVSALYEVVVTGYGVARSPSQIATESLMGRVAGVSVRGSRSDPADYYIDGVLMKKTKTMEVRDATSINLASDTLATSGIRKSFYDQAFWEPRLRTNRQGEAQFKVKFPDDITRWKVFVLGAGKSRTRGLYNGSIQSYKPLMAQLNTPRFLVHGDQTMLNGKILNYTPDSLRLRSYFQAKGQMIAEKQHLIKEVLVEKTEYTAPAIGDSLQFRFVLETPQGYTDGEERSIPLHPVGSLETQGSFMVLERDTVLHFANQEGKIQFRAQASALNLIMEDVQYLKDYPYDCNEQTASRLLGLLAEKQICQALQKPFNAEKLIRGAIARLNKTQNPDGSWGWWPNTAANTYMSNYVLQALVQAQQAGYSSDALEKGLRYLVNAQPFDNAHDRLSLLQTFILADKKIEISPSLLDTLHKPYALLHDQLLSILIQQHLGLKPSLDTFYKYRQLDAYGGVFWEEQDGQNWNFHWYNHRLNNTLLAYQIAKQAGLVDEMRRIRIHLLAHRGYTQQGIRSPYGWRNTLEVAAVLKTILPDLLENQPAQIGTLQLSGALNGEVGKIALQATFDASQSLTLKLNGAGPFFCTAYQQSWNSNPVPKSDLFAVKSHLEYNGDKIKQLQFGQAAQLVVEVEVKQEAQYVMIEMPIPAGCSYFKKPQTYRSPEVHREYFADKVSIFCERLPIGKQSFTIDLEPRFSGTYTLNPARVEEMYFPVLYGRNSVEKVSVKP